MFMNEPMEPTLPDNGEQLTIELAPKYDGTRESLERYLEYQGIHMSIEEVDEQIPIGLFITYPSDLCDRVYKAVTEYFM